MLFYLPANEEGAWQVWQCLLITSAMTIGSLNGSKVDDFRLSDLFVFSCGGDFVYSLWLHVVGA